MDDWQKDFWEVIETVALGIETFFQEVTQTIEEINEEIIIDLEQFIQEVLPQELEEFFNLDESLFSELDEPSDFTLTPKVNPDPNTHPACIGCRNYHGYIYGGNLLVCGFHPYGWDSDSCPDWQAED
jgi:hypothetical protein